MSSWRALIAFLLLAQEARGVQHPARGVRLQAPATSRAQPRAAAQSPMVERPPRPWRERRAIGAEFRRSKKISDRYPEHAISGIDVRAAGVVPYVVIPNRGVYFLLQEAANGFGITPGGKIPLVNVDGGGEGGERTEASQATGA